MMASAETIRCIAAALRRHHVQITVIDPVCANETMDYVFSDVCRLWSRPAAHIYSLRMLSRS